MMTTTVSRHNHLVVVIMETMVATMGTMVIHLQKAIGGSLHLWIHRTTISRRCRRRSHHKDHLRDLRMTTLALQIQGRISGRRRSHRRLQFR